MTSAAQMFSTGGSRDLLSANSNATGKSEYNAVDLTKFICAILVVSIHIAPFGTANDRLLSMLNYGIQNWLARIAAPIFFAASGFFLYRKTTPESFSLKPTMVYAVKLVRLYAIWALLYSPFRLNAVLGDERGVICGILADVVFMGRYTQLWFIPALIFAVVLTSFLLSRKIGSRKILTAALIFYALGLLGQSWFGIIAPLKTRAPELWSLLEKLYTFIGTTRNGLFDGFLFVGMGAHIAFNGFKIPQKKAFIGFAVSYFLMLVEAVLVKYFDFALANDMYIFLVPTVYFAFGFVVNYRIPSKDGVYKTLRVVSALVYYSHLWILSFIIMLFNLLGIQIGAECLPFVLTLIGSVIFSYVVCKLSERPYFRWLKILYS